MTPYHSSANMNLFIKIPLHLIKFLRENKIFTIILILLILSRVLKFHLASSLEPDEGRDILVGRHIAVYKETLPVGHHCSGIDGLYYSTNYYKFIALLTSIHDDPYSIFFFITIFHILAGVLLYFSINLIINKKVALLMFLIFVISPQFIIANNVWGAYTSFVFQIYSLFFYSLWIKKSKSKALFVCLHYFFFAFACSVSPLGIFFIPLYIVLTIYLKKKLFSFFYIFGYFFFVLFFNLDLINYYKKNFLFLLVNHIKMNLFTFPFEDLIRIFNIISRDILGISLFNYSLICFILILSLFIIKNKYKNFALILLTYFSSTIIIFSQIFPHRIYTHHLLPFYLIIYLPSAIAIWNILEHLDYLKSKLFLILILTVYIVSPKYHNFKTFPYNSLVEFDQASQVIIKYIKKIHNSNEKMAVVQNSNTIQSSVFPSPEIYYFIERKLQRRLIKIVPETQFNIEFDPQKFFKEKNIIFICRKYWEQPSYPIEKCFGDLLSPKRIERIYTSKNMKIYLLRN